MVPSHICRSPMPWVLLHPHTITRLVFALFVGNSLDGLSSLACRIQCPFFLKTSWNVDLFPLSFDPSQMISVPYNSAAFLHKMNKCLPLCMIFQMIFQSTPKSMWLCPSWWHDGFSNSTAWGLDGHAHSAAVAPLGLSHRDFPWLPESFHNIMNLDGERPKLLTSILRWETLSLNWLTILSWSLAQSYCPNYFWVCCSLHILFFFKNIFTKYNWVCQWKHWTVMGARRNQKQTREYAES